MNLFGEPLEPKVAHRAHPDVVMAPGNHSLCGADLAVAPTAGLLEIFHYPMRSYEQFERKVLQIGRAYEPVQDRSPGTGRDQLRLLELHRCGDLRRYWDEARRDDSARPHGLVDGTLVIDRRLDEFMRTRGPALVVQVRPDSLATQEIVAALLTTTAERDAGRQAVIGLGAELEVSRTRQTASAQALECAQAELGAVRSELGAARDKIAVLRSDLHVSTQLLDTVRNSRVMRWPRPLRRLWHRIR